MRRLLRSLITASKASMSFWCFASLNIGVSFARESFLHGRAPNEVSNQNKRKAERRRRKPESTIEEKQFKFANDLKCTAIAPSAFKVYSALLWIFNTRSTFLCSAKLTSFLSIKIKQEFFSHSLCNSEINYRNSWSITLHRSNGRWCHLYCSHFWTLGAARHDLPR